RAGYAIWRTWPRPSSAHAPTTWSRPFRTGTGSTRCGGTRLRLERGRRGNSFRRAALRDARWRAPGQGRALGGHVVLGEHVRRLPGAQGRSVAHVAQEPLGHLGEVILVPDAQAIGDGDPELRAEVLHAHSRVRGLQRRHLLLYGGEQGGLVGGGVGDEVELRP